jgi:hypothetical protein
MSTSYPIKYSFSGSDCKVYAYYKKTQAIHLDNISTVSVSVHEAKAPVRRLGHMAPVGYTRGIRTIAGSLVFTIVGSEHPLEYLRKNDPKKNHYWSKDNSNSRNNPVRLSPFNLMLLYKTELPHSVGSKLVLKKVEFLNEGIVTSVNDLISEVVMQFVALDIDEFALKRDFTLKGTVSDSQFKEIRKQAKEDRFKDGLDDNDFELLTDEQKNVLLRDAEVLGAQKAKEVKIRQQENEDDDDDGDD